MNLRNLTIKTLFKITWAWFGLLALLCIFIFHKQHEDINELKGKIRHLEAHAKTVRDIIIEKIQWKNK